MKDVTNKILTRKSLMEASGMHSWITGGRSGGKKNSGGRYRPIVSGFEWKISNSFRVPAEDLG
jgi:hypothetical protein